MKVYQFVGILLLALVVGCAPRKQALVLPARTVEASGFAGSTLSGPQSRPIELADVWRVEVKPYLTDGQLPPATSHIGPLVKLILVTRSREPTQPATDLTWAVRLRDGLHDESVESLLGAPGTFLAMPPSQSALPRNATATFTLDTGTPGGYLSLQINRNDRNDGYDLAIVRDGQVVDTLRKPPPSTQPLKDAPDAPLPMKWQREIAIVPRLIDQGRDHYLLTAPARFADSPARQMVFEIDLQTHPDPAMSPELLAAFTNSAARAAEASAASATTRPAANPEEAMYTSGFKSLSAGGDPRATITYLANQANAKLCESLALSADRRVLDLLSHNILETGKQLPSRDRNTVRWILDRTAYLLLAQLAEVETPPCPEELLSLLMEQAGEVGAHPDAVRGIVKEATGSDDLAARLVAENFIYLEDASPASRVRAFDWLRARDLAPKAFDPLGTVKERRTALNNAASTK